MISNSAAEPAPVRTEISLMNPPDWEDSVPLESRQYQVGLVSVIIPTYNRGYCLARAIESVLAQSYQSIEVLVVDDGSTDYTRTMLADRYSQEPRVRVFHQANCGVSEARNTGFRQSRGEFIAFLNSDDYWQPWKVAAQVAILRKFPEVGMVWTDMEARTHKRELLDPHHLRRYYGAYDYFTNEQLFPTNIPLADFDPDLKTPVSQAPVRIGQIFSQMIMGNLVHTSTTMIRRERLQQVGFFNSQLRGIGEDYDFLLRVCRFGPVALLDAPAIVYTRGGTDRLTRRENHVDGALNFLNVITPYLQFHRDEIALPEYMIRRVLAESHGWIGESALNAGDRVLARKHLWKSLKLHPFQRRGLALWLASLMPGERSLRGVYRLCKRFFPAAPKPA